MFTSSGRRSTRLLNRLSAACKDDQVALRATLEALRSSPVRSRVLLDRIERRGVFQRELSISGGKTASHASLRPYVTAFGRRLRAELEGAHEGDAYRALAKAERRTEALYRAALHGELSDSTRPIIQRQYAEIASDASLFRLLQWQKLAAEPLARVLARIQAVKDSRESAEELSRWDDDGGWQH